VREVPVIHTSDTEHSDRVERHAHRERYPAKASPNYQEASEVNCPERGLLDEVEGMERITAGIHILEMSPGARSFSQATGGILNELRDQAKTAMTGMTPFLRALTTQSKKLKYMRLHGKIMGLLDFSLKGVKVVMGHLNALNILARGADEVMVMVIWME
jgi:hypothetical protein